MEVSDALKIMTAVEDLNTGTPQAVERVNYLNEALIKDPEGFSDVLWDNLNPPSEHAKELFRSGVVTEETTFGQMKEILTKGVHDR